MEARIVFSIILKIFIYLLNCIRSWSCRVGSLVAAQWAVAPGRRCSVPHGILMPGMQIELSPLHCKADSESLDHQGSPNICFLLTQYTPKKLGIELGLKLWNSDPWWDRDQPFWILITSGYLVARVRGSFMTGPIFTFTSLVPKVWYMCNQVLINK